MPKKFTHLALLLSALCFIACDNKDEPKTTEPSDAQKKTSQEADNTEKLVNDSIGILQQATAAMKAGEDDKAQELLKNLQGFKSRGEALGINLDNPESIPEPYKKKFIEAKETFFKFLQEHNAKNSDEPTQPDTSDNPPTEDGDTPETVIQDMIKNFEAGTPIVTALSEGVDPEANIAKYKVWKKEYHEIQSRMQKFDKEMENGHSDRAKALREKYSEKIAKAFSDFGHASVKAVNSEKTPAEAKALIQQP